MGIGRATLIEMPTFTDERGHLTVAEGCRQIPFAIARVYFVHGVPPGRARGGHAHRRGQEVLLAVTGSLEVELDDGRARRRVTLDRPDVGLYVPPLVWGRQERFAAGTVCLVLASLPYDERDYCRDYDEFLRLASA
ncbi:MAG TPA: FdtA/QdtA family cupin domain-containing protein [Thermomicrobiales bacterium]|nr:FdtA/QdtA family cupin domain-containing protein [Thermomicrobiales bacterium]